MFRALFLAALLWALTPVSPVQAGLNAETGSPAFQYYSQNEYNASPQNWAIAQDRRGILYFANTDGVLEFDGTTWRQLRLNSTPTVKSVATDSAGNVYVGGLGDFGLLRSNASGALQFTSLLEKVPSQDRRFLDVWRILPTAQGVYFSAYHRLFRLNNDGSVRVWRPVSNFGRAFYAMGSLYVKTPEQGLMRMEGDTLKPAPGGSLFSKLGITSAIPFEGGALLATPQALYRMDANGVKPFPTNRDAWFKVNLFYTLHLLPNGEVLAGTRNGGLAFIDRDGFVDRIVSKANGLPDNHVEAIFTDAQGGVWVAGNNGLARFNPGLSLYGADAGLEGLVRCMVRQGASMYAGSTAGLFLMESAAGSEPVFRRVEGIATNVSALLPIDGGLLAATDAGVFRVSGKHATPIFASTHELLYFDVSASAADASVVYVAGRAGVFRLRRKGTGWAEDAELTLPGQEFHTVVEDPDGRVWATTQDSIWRIDFRAQPVRSEKFGAAQGISPLWLNSRRLSDHVAFGTSKGLRRYSDSLKTFVPDVTLGAEFADGSRDVFNIFEGPQGNVWVTGQKYHGVLMRRTGGDKWLPMPLLGAGIAEIYWMALDADGVEWATGAKGVLYRREGRLYGNPDAKFNVLTRSVRDIAGKRDLYAGAGDFGARDLPFRQNALRFEFAAPFYEDPASVEYRYRLEGSDRDWSEWNRETKTDYTHLPPGSYRFRVMARSPHGAAHEQAALTFGVMPPWYRTWWAYTFYALIASFGVWGVVRLRTSQLEEEKRQLEVIVEERTAEIREQRDEIKEQERKSHSLLLNILPATVADELKATGVVQPVGFDDVTVCFTDFVGFTLSSEKMQPARLVDALNEYFTRFDEIIARYGLEKLKTIGDSYMFASGLPTPRDSHAVDAVLAALEMVEVVKELAVKEDGTGWNIRVGLHSGPVVAGVVGTRKFAFDIWGNTVNFAARMESSGMPGRVNMSERTCRLTRGLIDCESRGHVRIKEGRELPMFLARTPVHGLAARYEEEFGHTAPDFQGEKATGLSVVSVS